MVRELAELVDQQVAVLGGAWGTMVQSKTLRGKAVTSTGAPQAMYR